MRVNWRRCSATVIASDQLLRGAIESTARARRLTFLGAAIL
jgi:hypothetical protein